MLVHFITDEPNKFPAIRAILDPRHELVARVLGSGDALLGTDGVFVVDVDLRQAPRVEQVRQVLQPLSAACHKLFVVHNPLGAMAAQARALGATAVISSTKEVVFRLARIEEAEKAGKRDLALPNALTDCAAAFASMFLAVRAGKPINLSDATRATSQIIDRVHRSGLTSYLDEVRRYHEGTFQHCLLVTGVAVGFGIEIGFSCTDVSRLGVAATLHDIGKACIPLDILDKPGKLDAGEDEIMKRHPGAGYDLLKGIPDMTPEILDGVRHHHEYLDGSGYPDRLTSCKISDLVRLLTISDIFAALIEARPYRAPMPRHTAYQILCDMNGKLETSLVKAFKNVALPA
jgi:HD-GYP domain-containing protein (c-di-GMP phosphodiesterase class II)